MQRIWVGGRDSRAGDGGVHVDVQIRRRAHVTVHEARSGYRAGLGPLELDCCSVWTVEGQFDRRCWAVGVAFVRVVCIVDCLSLSCVPEAFPVR